MVGDSVVRYSDLKRHTPSRFALYCPTYPLITVVVAASVVVVTVLDSLFRHWLKTENDVATARMTSRNHSLLDI
jgi:hypothetical protein